MRTITITGILAIILACMGLFGLSALYALNRTKEVGIRKVMGASIRDIFILLNRDAIRLALVAIVIAVPFSIYSMNKWLQNFAYRISLTWVYFAVAGVIGLTLALIAVSYHSIRAALTNPVKSLRTE
jgi:putative ABC transport system permease protein